MGQKCEFARDIYTDAILPNNSLVAEINGKYTDHWLWNWIGSPSHCLSKCFQWPRLITVCIGVFLGTYGMLPGWLLRGSTHASHASLAIALAYFLVFTVVGIIILNGRLSRLKRKS